MINYKRAIFDSVKKYLHTRDIIVLHGARQAGKTYLLHAIEGFLRREKQQTYYMDLEDRRLLTILNQGIEQFMYPSITRG